ncbi:MAG TPA: DNA primase, partial [Candidatus Nitrosotalea sp.]|nr:DNA primase [Candidatus Nitrosotalea sp.]
MGQLGTQDFAKYPFLAEAGNYLQDKGLTLEQLVHPDWAPLLERAYGRIVVATSGQIYDAQRFEKKVYDSNEIDVEILSFIVATILLKSANINTLTRRFSLSESRRAEKHLESDLKQNKESDVIKVNFALKIIQDLFSVTVIVENDEFLMNVPSYIKRAVHFHEKEWKLVNRSVSNGFVHLSAHETVRLIRTELGEYITSRIKSIDLPPLPEIFVRRVNDLVSLATKFSETTYVSSEYPPCVKHGIEVLEKGENLPHSGRFLLATYLLSKGQTVDQIAPLFKNAPDY